MPVRRLTSHVATGWPRLEDWLVTAYLMGLRTIDLHCDALPLRTPEALRALGRRLDRHGLQAGIISATTDFAHPDPDSRRLAVDAAVAAIGVARSLGSGLVQVTPGQEHPDVDVGDAVSWCVDGLRLVADEFRPTGIALCVENHYRDPRRPAPSFAAGGEVFAQVMGRLTEAPIGVCFNTANPVMSGEDPVELFEHLQDRISGVRLCDRFPGHPSHTVLGQGAARPGEVLRRLAAVGYEGIISLEDNIPGGPGALAESLTQARRMIAQWWR
jgi:sugar phosphate isomerase/epimerase